MAFADIFSVAVTSIYYVVVFGLVVLFVAGLAWFIWWVLLHSKTVVVRTITGSKRIVDVQKCREYRDKKTGVYWWSMLWRRHKIPRPPPEAIDTTKKGKEWAEVYYTGQGSYVPVMDSVENHRDELDAVASLPGNLGYVPINDDTKARDLEGFVKTLQPFKESQRIPFVNQLLQAHSYKKKGWSELLMVAVPIIGVIMIVAVFLIFYGEAAGPIADMAGQVASQNDRVMDRWDSITERQESLIAGLQVLNRVPVSNASRPPG